MSKEAPNVTTRPASTSILAVASKDRFADYQDQRYQIAVGGPNASPYDFTITKAGNLMSGFFTRLAVTEFSMDWTIPNINNYTDRIVISYQVGGTGPVTTSTYILDEGFFTPNEIAAELQAHIRTLHATLADALFVYDTFDQPYFEYSTGSTTEIAFAPATVTSTGQSIPATQKQLFDMLGFSDLQRTLSTGSVGSSTFCVYTDYIDIVCSQLTYNQPLKDTMTQSVSRDSLCRVYLNQINGPLNANTLQVTDAKFVPTGCTPFQIYHNYTHPKQINWTPNQNVGQLKFQVFDDSGNPLSGAVGPLVGGNWQMTLLVTEN